MRRKIGDIEMTALSDGPFPATLDTLLDFDRDEAQRLLGKPAGTPFFLPVNSYLLKLGGKWALVDTGCGPTAGPELGQLPKGCARPALRRRRSTLFCSRISIPITPWAWSTPRALRSFPMRS